jgi:hypothetical protein
LICSSTSCFRFARESAFGLEERAATKQTVQEAATKLTSSRQALCDVVLGTGRGSTQLALRLNEACRQVDPLVSTRVHSGVDYDAVGKDTRSKNSNTEILAIGNSVIRGAGVLTSKVLAAIVCLQFQASNV